MLTSDLKSRSANAKTAELQKKALIEGFENPPAFKLAAVLGPGLYHPESPLGDLIDDRYLIENLTGKGGQCFVYKAKDTLTGQWVAIKLLRAQRDERKYLRNLERLRREANGMSKLNHAHIVSCRHSNFKCDTPYIVMDLVEGKSLREWGRRAKPSVSFVQEMAIKLLSALDHLHGKGVIHRDVSAKNIMLTPDNSPQLLDFGLAKHAMEGESNLTSADTALGTLYYMAPEQCIASAKVDERADIYALGVVLFEALTGRVPIFASSVVGTMEAKVKRDPVKPSTKNPAISSAMDRFILKMIARNPKYRYRNAIEAITALEDVMSKDAQTSVISITTPSAVFETVELIPSHVKTGNVHIGNINPARYHNTEAVSPRFNQSARRRNQQLKPSAIRDVNQAGMLANVTELKPTWLKLPWVASLAAVLFSFLFVAWSNQDNEKAVEDPLVHVKAYLAETQLSQDNPAQSFNQFEKLTTESKPIAR